MTTVLAPEPGRSRPAAPSASATTVVRQLRRPRLEKVAGGPLTKAVVHGHALVPGLTEWLVAHAPAPVAVLAPVYSPGPISCAGGG